MSNGFLGVRCTATNDFAGRSVAAATTYVAGLFDTAADDAPRSALVPAVDWLALKIFAANGQSPYPGPFTIVLDMKRGVLLVRSLAEANGAAIQAMHLVSLRNRAIGVQMIEFRFSGDEKEIALEAAVDGKHSALVPDRIQRTFGSWRTSHSGKRLGVAMETSLHIDGTSVLPAASDSLVWSWRLKPCKNQTVTFERAVAFVRTDKAAIEAGIVAQQELETALPHGCAAVVAQHEAAWARRWYDSDVLVDDNAGAQLALRFAIFALNGAPDPDDERVSIGARGLTGADYYGHVFWDTEIFLLPFYVMTWPEAARTLLMYRYHTLGGARAKAARMGWRGALYAWESADTGDETAPQRVVGPDRQIVEVLSGTLEQHISADVAYAVWQYWLATGDEAFLLAAGAEILLETGRFWASRATLEPDGRCHIRNVVGPDEYHEHVDDNAFTNVMARWNIRRAIHTAGLLAERWPERWAVLSEKLVLGAAELEDWRSVAETIVTGFDPNTGLFEQFAGYFALEQIDLDDYAGRSVPMDVILGRERTHKSQVIKQADVVALLALLPEEFPGTSGAANFRYYAPRCDHGSSLSRAMHCLAATRVGEHSAALTFFTDLANIDLRDTHAAIGGGIHIAAQGGIWLATIFGFSGLSIAEDRVIVEPRVPASWGGLHYRFQWRGRKVAIDTETVTQTLAITLEAGDAMPLRVDGADYELRPGAPLCLRTTTTGT